MTEINTQKFYQFLAKFGEDNAWAEVADGEHGNSDGYVIKSEFRSFLNAEWNGNENGELTNDIINKFWKAIDTNQTSSKISGTNLKNLNALDKNEMANLEKRLEVYTQFDSFVEDNVEIPTVLATTGSQWRSDVVDQLSALVEEFIKGGCSGDLESILTAALPGISNKCTAQYCAVEYQETLKNSVLKDYSDYKVADDSTLQGLINSYVATIDAQTDDDIIHEDIMAIIDAYLATAELGEGDVSNLDAYGLNLPIGLNYLQTEVIKQTIKNDLADEAKKYEGYETQFNEAVQKFIDAKIKEGGTFDALKAAAGEFATSEFAKNLDNMITIDKTYRDVTESSEFYKRLVEEFGQTLADKIAKNDRYIQAYKDIINDVIAKVNAGEMTMEEVADYVIKEISANLEKFFTNGLDDMSIEELNETYDKLATAAESQTDDEEAWKLHQEAAIKWCDAISKKGAALKAAIAETLEEAGYPSDYKTAFKEMYPGDIQAIMEILKAKVLEIGDVKEFTLESLSIKNGGTEVSDDLGATPNSTGNLRATATIKNGNNTIDSNRISYGIKATNGSASIDKLGNIKYTAGNETGYMTMEVYVMVDGIKIGSPKTIKVNICRDNSAIIEDIKSREENSGKIECKDTYITSGSINKYSFTSLYNNDVAIRLYDANVDGNQFSSLKPTVKTNLTNVLTNIVSVLTNSGLDPSLLNTCKTNVLKKYMDNFTGADVSPWDKNAEQSDADNAAYNHVHENRHQLTYAHVRANDWHADNHSVMVNFKDLVDDILAEYRKLGGTF